MAEKWFDIDKIKLAMKKASSSPIPFAFGIGGSPAEGKLAMHPKREPSFLLRALKKEGYKASRIVVGTAETDGSTLIVTCEKEVPKAKKSIRFFLRENQLRQKKVRLIGPNGEFDADDEDEQEPGVAAQAEPDSPDEEQAAFKRRLTELAPKIKKAVNERGADGKPIAVKFKQAHTLGQSGDYEGALALFDEVDELLESAPQASPQADALAAEWNKRVKQLAPQIKGVLTAKLEGSRDVALKFKEAQAFESKKDYKSGIAMLDEVSTMIEDLQGGGNELAAEWTKRFKALESDLLSVLQQNLGDPSKLRAARDMAMEKADGGDHATALKVLDRLEPAVKKALANAAPSGEDKKAGIAPGVAFTQSRLAWNGARQKIQAELKSLEQAIIDAAKDDDPEIFAQVKGKTALLYDILGKRDEALMDKLDEGLNAEKDSPAQIKAYGEASKLVKDYVSYVNGSPLVQEIDSNPFKNVAVKKTLDQTLKVLASRLAA